VATCGKMVAPPLFETLEILGQATVLKRLDQTLARLGVGSGVLEGSLPPE